MIQALEIDRFFEKEKFEELELRQLKYKLRKKYGSAEFNQVIDPLVNINLINYVRFNICKGRRNKWEAEYRKKVSGIGSFSVVLFNDFSIEQLSKFLGLKSKKVITSILRQNGIIKTADDTLEDSEFELIKDFVFKRLRILGREAKRNRAESQLTLPKMKVRSRAIGVWAYLATNKWNSAIVAPNRG